MKARKADGSDTITLDEPNGNDDIACQEVLPENFGGNEASASGSDSLLADEADEELEAVLAGANSARECSSTLMN